MPVPFHNSWNQHTYASFPFGLWASDIVMLEGHDNQYVTHCVKTWYLSHFFEVSNF